MGGNFFVVHPPRYATRDPLMAGDPVVLEVPIVAGKSLHQHFRDLRLNDLRTRCRMTLDPQNVPLRISYVPKAGDVIRMERVRALG